MLYVDFHIFAVDGVSLILVEHEHMQPFSVSHLSAIFFNHLRNQNFQERNQDVRAINAQKIN